MLLIDIPNQIKPKSVYLRGQAHERQLSVRVFEPFDWRPVEELQKNYEKPLELLNAPTLASGEKKRILLQYLRDEEAINFEYKFKADQNRIRQIAISSCRLTDIKMEKPCSYEIAPKVANDPYFECDQPKGAVPGGTETVCSFKFKPPQVDPLLKDIGALKGLGQWVESVWDLKLQGGYFEL